MSGNDFVSSIKTIPFSQQAVYNKLSDLNNLRDVKEKLSAPGAEERLQQLANDNNESRIAKHFTNLKEKLEKVTFDTDTITFGGSPMGDISLCIVEREEPKTIKFEGKGTPIAATLWIQLLPVDETSCKMRITLRAELNFFIRQMASKPLQEGVEKMADVLASIPYNQLG